MADEFKPDTSRSKEEEFLALLVARGLLKEIRPRSCQPRVRRLIVVEGRPISEELIEDRR